MTGGRADRPRRRRAAALLAGALVVAACSDDGGGATSSSTVSTEDAEAATAYAEPGPFPVGVSTLPVGDGDEVEVWYPAVDGTEGTTGYDVRDFVPESLLGPLTADVPATFELDGARDPAVADGAFPVVLFSHGYSGIRVQSSFLTSHLATYGMVVVAPDHPSRDLAGVLNGTASRDREEEAVADLLAALDLIVAEGATSGSRFEGHIDGERVATLGHAAGGRTALEAAKDERITGYVSMASGGPEATADYPERPSFFLAGSSDGEVSAADQTRPAFEAAPSPTLLWELAEVGHNGFDDFCTFGGGTGIVGLAEASGLDDFLEAQPELRDLGEDGCVRPAAPVNDAYPIIRHAVTAWMRWQLGDDPEPVGLFEVPEDAFELDVTIEER
jgi:dienelactone hydrolase